MNSGGKTFMWKLNQPQSPNLNYSPEGNSRKKPHQCGGLIKQSAIRIHLASWPSHYCHHNDDLEPNWTPIKGLFGMYWVYYSDIKCDSPWILRCWNQRVHKSIGFLPHFSIVKPFLYGYCRSSQRINQLKNCFSFCCSQTMAPIHCLCSSTQAEPNSVRACVCVCELQTLYSWTSFGWWIFYSISSTLGCYSDTIST